MWRAWWRRSRTAIADSDSQDDSSRQPISPLESTDTGAALPSRRLFRISIRLKLLGVLVVLASLVSFVVAYRLLALFTDDKLTYIRDRNTEYATNSAASIELLLDVYRDRARRAGEFVDAFEDPSTVLADWFESSEEFVCLSVYDETGTSMLNLLRWRSVVAAGIDVDGYHRRRHALEPNVSYLRAHRGHVWNSTESAKLPTITVAIPYYSRRYDKWLSISGDVRAERMLDVLRGTHDFKTVVVAEDATLFLHADGERMVGRPSLAGDVVVQAILNGLSNRTGASARTGEFTDADGDAVLASWATVRGTGLGVVVERRRSDAYLAADRVVKQSMQSAIAVIVIAALFSVYLSRAATRSLLALSKVARSLERGDFNVEVGLDSNDELGDLARSFNMAAHGLKDRQEKLKLAYEQLLQSEKLAGFGKLSAGIAHEIKNPLTGILGFAQILQRKVADDDPAKRHLQMIEKEARRCKGILDNLLKFTRKESFQLVPLGIHGHLRETLDLCEPQLVLNRVRISVELAAPEDEIQGDTNQLRQVFMNLILNSLDAMEDSAEKQIQIRSRPADGNPGYLTIALTDTGTGIPDAVIRKVFDPFFSTKEPGKGTGLGLSVTYGIIINHGGSIRVRNVPGMGAEFEITLPLNPDRQAGAQVSAPKGLPAREVVQV